MDIPKIPEIPTKPLILKELLKIQKLVQSGGDPQEIRSQVRQCKRNIVQYCERATMDTKDERLPRFQKEVENHMTHFKKELEEFYAMYDFEPENTFVYHVSVDRHPIYTPEIEKQIVDTILNNETYLGIIREYDEGTLLLEEPVYNVYTILKLLYNSPFKGKRIQDELTRVEKARNQGQETSVDWSVASVYESVVKELKQKVQEFAEPYEKEKRNEQYSIMSQTNLMSRYKTLVDFVLSKNIDTMDSYQEYNEYKNKVLSVVACHEILTRRVKYLNIQSLSGITLSQKENIPEYPRKNRWSDTEIKERIKEILNSWKIYSGNYLEFLKNVSTKQLDHFAYLTENLEILQNPNLKTDA
jgi:hypothetical protein